MVVRILCSEHHNHNDTSYNEKLFFVLYLVVFGLMHLRNLFFFSQQRYKIEKNISEFKTNLLIKVRIFRIDEMNRY